MQRYIKLDGIWELVWELPEEFHSVKTEILLGRGGSKAKAKKDFETSLLVAGKSFDELYKVALLKLKIKLMIKSIPLPVWDDSFVEGLELPSSIIDIARQMFIVVMQTTGRFRLSNDPVYFIEEGLTSVITMRELLRMYPNEAHLYNDDTKNLSSNFIQFIDYTWHSSGLESALIYASHSEVLAYRPELTIHQNYLEIKNELTLRMVKVMEDLVVQNLSILELTQN
jgi:hypothetical protein